MRFPTMWYVGPAKPQISLRGQSLYWSLEYSMIVKLLTEHHLEFLSLKGGCRGSSESTHVKMPHCWKSHVMAHLSRIYMARVILPLASLRTPATTASFSIGFKEVVTYNSCPLMVRSSRPRFRIPFCNL